MNFSCSFLAQDDLEDSVRSRGVIVSRRDTGRAHLVAVGDESEHVINAPNDLLFEANDLNLLFTILQHTKFQFVVQ